MIQRNNFTVSGGRFLRPARSFTHGSMGEVSSAVSGQTYDYIVKLVREFGNYPIQLPAEFDEKV